MGSDPAKGLAGAYTQFEEYLQKALVVGLFAMLDACLTDAYDQAIKRPGRQPLETLEDCQAGPRFKLLNTCGYTITEQLHLLTYNPERITAALAAIEKSCPLPPDMQITGDESVAAKAARASGP